MNGPIFLRISGSVREIEPIESKLTLRGFTRVPGGRSDPPLMPMQYRRWEEVETTFSDTKPVETVSLFWREDDLELLVK